MRNTNVWRLWRPRLVRPLVDLKLGNRKSRSWLVVRLAGGKRIHIAQLAEDDSQVASARVKRVSVVVQGKEFSDSLVSTELLLSLRQRCLDYEGWGGRQPYVRDIWIGREKLIECTLQ